MNTLSRNTPIAFVVGAAGFIGSHIVEKLLEKGIQVVGVDNLSNGRRENLKNVTNNSHFQFINHSLADFRSFDLPRLDYAVFVISEDINSDVYTKSLENFLKIVEPFNPKTLFISSTELYQQKHTQSLLKHAESRFAKYAAEKKTNARVVRLGPVYGPRMHFRMADPLFELISQTLHHQDLPSQLEFSSRALYIDDAVNLVMKTLFHGATAHKIYDGSLLFPIKIEEITQILKDPLWYEHQHFTPTLLPAWPTPNLIKTQKELAWKPAIGIVAALRETLAYFHNRPDLVGKIEKKEGEQIVPQAVEEPNNSVSMVLAEKEKNNVKKDPAKNPLFWQDIFNPSFKKTVIATFLIAITTYALFYPFFELFLNTFILSRKIQDAQDSMVLGEFIKADEQLQLANNIAGGVSDSMDSILLLKALHAINPAFNADQAGVELLKNGTQALHAMSHASKTLNSYLKVISGGQDGDSNQLVSEAISDYDRADRLLGVLLSTLHSAEFMHSLPSFLVAPFKDLDQRAQDMHNSVIRAKAVSQVLQSIPKDHANYLVIWVNSSTLRSGGGQITAITEIEFDKGKISQSHTKPVTALEQSIKEVITPPTDLVTSSLSNTWHFRDVLIDVDLQTNARNTQWFYQKATAKRIDGIIFVNDSAAESLLKQFGPINISNGTKIDGSFYRHLLTDSKPESEETLSRLYQELVNRITFIADGEWSKVTEALGAALYRKDIQLTFIDEPTQQLINEVGWGRGIQSIAKSSVHPVTISEDLVSKVESPIKRDLEINSQVQSESVIKHQVVYALLNQSAAEGDTHIYNSRLRIYLPRNWKLESASIGGESVLSQISSFSDYGLSGYSLMINLKPKEQKSLVLELSEQKGLFTKDSREVYQSLILKQPGVKGINLHYKFVGSDQILVNGVSQPFEIYKELIQDEEISVTLEKK